MKNFPLLLSIFLIAILCSTCTRDGNLIREYTGNYEVSGTMVSGPYCVADSVGEKIRIDRTHEINNAILTLIKGKKDSVVICGLLGIEGCVPDDPQYISAQLSFVGLSLETKQKLGINVYGEVVFKKDSIFLKYEWLVVTNSSSYYNPYVTSYGTVSTKGVKID